MDNRPRIIDHSKRWTKIRRQLAGETTTTPPPPSSTTPPTATTTTSPAANEDSDPESGDEDEIDSGDDDGDDSSAEDSEPGTGSPPAQPQSTRTSTVPISGSGQTTIQTSSSPTSVSGRPATSAASPTTALDAAVTSSSPPTTTATSLTLPPAGVSSQSSQSLPAGTIAGIAVACIVGAVCLAAAIHFMLICLCRRRRRQRQRQEMSLVGDLYGDWDRTQVSSRGPPRAPTANSTTQIPSFGPSKRAPPPPQLSLNPHSRPQFPLNLPVHPQAYIPSAPFPVRAPAPAPASPQAPAPAHITTSSPTVSPIPHGSQPGAPPSTLSPMRTVFVPQNRASITPSDSISNLFYDRAGVDREIEKLRAMTAGRNAAAGSGHPGGAPGRFGKSNRWI